MAGPWEQFQQPRGPWEQFQQPRGPWDNFAPTGATPAPPNRVQSIADAVVNGFQSNALGLAVRGKLPEQQMGEDAPWYLRLASGMSNVVSDIPLSVAGALVGAPVGAAVSGPAAPLGAMIGGGAGAFGVPMALREALIEAYSNNHAASWQGVWEIAKAALKGGGKGAVIGGLTGGAGALVGRTVGAAIAPSIGTALTVKTAERAIGTAAVGTELATMTTLSAAVEGRMPTAQDFMDGAILLGGMKAATHVAKGLRRIYAEAGKHPMEVASDAARDPALKAQLTADLAGLERARENNVFTGQAPGAGRLVGKTQPKGTPPEKLFSNFADEMKPGALPAFRGKMFDRANASPKSSTNDPVATTELPFGEGLAVRVEAAKAGGTRVQVLDGDSVLAAARIDKGLFDSVAVTEAAKGRGIGERLVRFLRDERIANVEEVPDRSPGFVKVQKKVLSEPVGPATETATPAIPTAYGPAALAERVKAAVDSDAFTKPEAVREAFNAGGKPLGESAKLVDWSYVTDGDTLKGVLAQATEKWAPEIESQRRGVVTNAKSLTDAKALIESGATGPHKIGAAENSAQVLVRAALLRDGLNHAYGELAKIANVPKADLTPAMKIQALAAVERVAMLNAEFAGARAEAGRALQIFRLLKADPNLMGEANILIGTAERKGPLQDLARIAVRLKEPEQLNAMLREYNKPTFTAKALELWKAGILSGPLTQLANVMGNVTKYMVEVPESALAATIFAVDSAAKGDPITMAQWKARALAPLYGVQLGAVDALHVAAEVWKGKGESLEKADVYQNAIPGKAGEVIRLPFKALQVEDALFRTMAERAEAYKMAVDRATKEGLHAGTSEFREKVVQYTQQPGFGLNESGMAKAIEQVQKAGAEAVFAQRLGPALETIQGAIAKHAPAVGFVLPFIRTPANLVSWAVQHVPGLNLLSGRWRADYAAGGEAQARAISRVLIGAGITSTALVLTQDGVLTGGGMFDKEQGNAKRAAGWQPYSVKVGDTYYSYQRIEPVAKVMGLAADLIELMQASDEKDSGKIAAMLVLMFGNATISTTYLSGLSNVIQAATDPARKGEPLMEQYATSLVPKIVGQLTTMADPHKREVDGVLDAIQSQLPYFREKLLPKRDVWGEPMANDRWFSVMPVATSQISQDKVRTEAQRLQLAIMDVEKYATERGPLNAKDRRIEFSPEQRDIMREVSGKNAMTLLAPMVNSADWERIPDFAKAAIFKKVLEGTRKQGQYAALPPDDAARMQVIEKQANEILRQVQEAQGVAAPQPAPERRVR